MLMPDRIAPHDLMRRLAGPSAPVVIDARSPEDFAAAARTLPAARRLDAPTRESLGPAPAGVACYCVHGRAWSQTAAATLRAAGVAAAWVEGGIEGWTAAALPTVARAPDAAARFGAGGVWVTRRRPKVDRVACPWLLRRFVDPRARFLFVDSPATLGVAAMTGGVAFDVEGAPVTHGGDGCSFDALLDRYEIEDAALRRLALAVRGADTERPDLAPEAAGLRALSLGLSLLESDDHALLDRGFALYDALHAHLRWGADERHVWPPTA
jgi:rhodanese-related sulfurtransferase